MLTVSEINQRIEDEHSSDTEDMLSDKSMLEKYKESKSVKSKLKKLETILKEYIEPEISNKVMFRFITDIIPAGTKGVLRGQTFNSIIKTHITGLNLDSRSFEVNFEKKCKLFETAEIPDWYIIQKETGKIIIGMNQLDLWKGGHQSNRGSKYIHTTNYPSKVKLLCVVCNKTVLKSAKSKTYQLFNRGFSDNTLCYIGNLSNIIHSFFNSLISKS